MGSVIGVDIGGTHVRLGAVNRQYELSHFEMLPTASLVGPRLLDALAEVLLDYVARNLPAGKPPRAFALGFPSTLNRERTRVLSTPNVPGLDNIDMVAEMQQRLKLPVYIDRDVNMLFRYDVQTQRLPTAGVALGCYIGTGLGNVIAIDGRILFGKNGVAAELGHIPVMGRHDPCGCGNAGCMELYASGKALAALREAHFADTSFEALFVRHGADARLEEYVRCLALPVAMEINLLDPEYVILGGGVLHMPNFPHRRLEQYIRQYARKPYPAENVCLYYTHMAQENGVIGAGIYAFSLLDPSNKTTEEGK